MIRSSIRLTFLGLMVGGLTAGLLGSCGGDSVDTTGMGGRGGKGAGGNDGTGSSSGGASAGGAGGAHAGGAGGAIDGRGGSGEGGHGSGTGGSGIAGTAGHDTGGGGGTNIGAAGAAGGAAGAATGGSGGGGAAGGSGVGGAAPPVSCSGTSMVPGQPVLWSPVRGAYTGSPTAGSTRMTLRPTFVWHAPAGCAPDTFDIQIDDSCPPGQITSCAFPSPEVASSVPATVTRFTPATPMAVRTTAPVGAIYSWRVRACASPGSCGPWSDVGYLNVGRVSNDINGDGYADLIATSNGPTLPQSLEIYAGGTTPAASPPFHLGASAGSDAYSQPRFIGDVNGDGFADFVVWRQYNVPTIQIVPVVFFGGPDLTALSSTDFTSDRTLTTTLSNFRDAGDINGDGFSDVAASLAGRSATQQFNLYIYFGAAVFADKAPDLQTLGIASTPNQAGDTSGTVGDINGDGFSDMAMFHSNLTGPRQGLVRIYLGGKTPDIAGDGDISFTDFSVVDGPSGDVDGDGYDDVLLNSGGYGILPGGPTVPTSFTVIDAAHTVSLSGFDINGDGWNDILLSGANGLVLGGPSPMTAAGLTGLTADSTTRALTWADYNGDGRVDFADGDSGTAGVFLLLNDGTLNPVPTAQLPAPAVSPYALTGIIATGH